MKRNPCLRELARLVQRCCDNVEVLLCLLKRGCLLSQNRCLTAVTSSSVSTHTYLLLKILAVDLHEKGFSVIQFSCWQYKQENLPILNPTYLVEWF